MTFAFKNSAIWQTQTYIHKAVVRNGKILLKFPSGITVSCPSKIKISTHIWEENIRNLFTKRNVNRAKKSQSNAKEKGQLKCWKDKNNDKNHHWKLTNTVDIS